MIRRRITIVNKLGLHARAAAKFVELASRFESDVQLAYDTAQVNAKSIMGIMMLAAGQGSVLELLVNGPDEGEAAAALNHLVEDRFGEDE